MNHLGIFAKFWQPGKVKTRLAASIGNENACQAYLAMLSFLIDRLSNVGDRRTIGYSPTDRRSAFESLAAELGGRWEFVAQVDSTLGDRMSHFFETTFAGFSQTDATSRDSRRPKTILIGSDCPYITPDLCNDAFAVLENNDVVLGPTFDGGYYLVGMSQHYHEIFSDITFSTESVLQETIQKMDQNQISYGLLPEKQDVDELPQLQSLLKHLEQSDNDVDQSAVLAGQVSKLRTAITSSLDSNPNSDIASS